MKLYTCEKIIDATGDATRKSNYNLDLENINRILVHHLELQFG